MVLLYNLERFTYMLPYLNIFFKLFCFLIYYARNDNPITFFLDYNFCRSYIYSDFWVFFEISLKKKRDDYPPKYFFGAN